MTGNRDQVRAFFDILYGYHDGLDGQWMLLWALPEKDSGWFKVDDLQKAAGHAADIARTSDVYLQCGLSPKKKSKRERCPASEVSSLVGLWSDIDVHTPYRKKSNLPPTMVDAQKIIEALPIKPSVLIHSGGGLQAWWPFNEPLIIEDDEDRARAQRIAKGWNVLIQRAARKMGFVVDSVHDLARVMRVPGTFNHKGEEAVEVKFIGFNDDPDRFDPELFEEFIPEDMDEEEGVVVQLDAYTISSESEPPTDKFQALYDLDKQFRQTWNKTRKDIKDWADDSQSSWDMSMATILAQVEWSDQQIVDTLVAYRRKHDEKPKLRADYYNNTLKRARKGAVKIPLNGTMSDGLLNVAAEVARERVEEQDLSDETIQSAEIKSKIKELLKKGINEEEIIFVVRRKWPEATNVVETFQEAETEVARERTVDQVADVGVNHRDHLPEGDDRIPVLLEGLSGALGIEINSIRKYLTDPPVYEMVARGRKITLGTVENLVEQRPFKNKLAASAGVLMPAFSRRDWPAIAQRLLDACVEEAVEDYSTDEGRTRHWIRGFIEAREPVTQTDEPSDWSDSAINHYPIIIKDTGSLFIPVTGIMKYVRKVEGDRLTNKEVGILMGKIGAKRAVPLQFRHEGQKVCRRGWELNPHLVSQVMSYSVPEGHQKID